MCACAYCECVFVGCVCTCVCVKLWLLTSQYSVSLSSGRSPLASSKKKSRLMNFLNPQSFPWSKVIRPLTLCTHVTGKDHGAVTTRAHTNIHTCTYMYVHTHTRTHTHTHTQPQHNRWQQLLTRMCLCDCTVSFSHPLPCVLPSCCLGWRI